MYKELLKDMINSRQANFTNFKERRQDDLFPLCAGVFDISKLRLLHKLLQVFLLGQYLMLQSHMAVLWDALFTDLSYFSSTTHLLVEFQERL
jgi:hypothetical protein